jgi:glycerol-3-phosphate dehydrogenase
VEPLRFIYLVYKGDRPGSWTLDFGLTVYDLLKRGGRNHHHLGAYDLNLLAPNLNLDGLRGAFGYSDAQTDDARLVFRVLREAELHGARTLNYTRARELIRDKSGAVRALAIEDVENGSTAEVSTRSVISAAGVWSGALAGSSEDQVHIRPLRGSHLVLPWETLPAAQSITFAHPEDSRPVFAYPWEGVTLVGTTDLDHEEPLDDEPAATPEEKDYLLEAVSGRFKDLSVSEEDLIGSFAGVRPVVFGGREDPSQEPREYTIRENKNFITVAGGKLATFQPISRRVTLTLQSVLGVESSGETSSPSMDPLQPRALQDAGEILSPLTHLRRRRITGRLGPDLPGFLEWVRAEDLEEIPDTPYTWAELKWAFEVESVIHLDDLLLRRVRLGHLLPQGGLTLKTEIQNRLQPTRDWSPERWENEWTRYRTLWETCYSPKPIRRS